MGIRFTNAGGVSFVAEARMDDKLLQGLTPQGVANMVWPDLRSYALNAIAGTQVPTGGAVPVMPNEPAVTLA